MIRDASQAAADPGPTVGAPRLLVVDDSDLERSALGLLLRKYEYEVDEAADGQAALLLIKKRAYDLLLLDLHLPVIDGFDVLAYLAKHMPDLPVIILSGMPPDEIGDGLHRLPSGELPPLLTKPVDPQQLMQIVDLKLAGELP